MATMQTSLAIAPVAQTLGVGSTARWRDDHLRILRTFDHCTGRVPCLAVWLDGPLVGKECVPFLDELVAS